MYDYIFCDKNGPRMAKILHFYVNKIQKLQSCMSLLVTVQQFGTSEYALKNLSNLQKNLL